MTLTYNGVDYAVTDDSIYRDITINVSDLTEACALVGALDGMTNYTFSANEYTDMSITKMTIIIVGDISVNVKLRKRSKTELVQDELESLRSAMQELAASTNKTTTAKINKILQKGVEE